MVEFSVWDIFRNLLLAARWTVALSLIAFIGGGIVGMALLVARLTKSVWAERFVAGYVALFQGTPLLMRTSASPCSVSTPHPGWRRRWHSRFTPARSWLRSGAAAWLPFPVASGKRRKAWP